MAMQFSENDIFKKTSLYNRFKEHNLCFVDVGSAGGVHPLIQPLSDFTSCICFEPDQIAYEELITKNNNTSFANINTYNTALSGEISEQTLYITKSNVCTSLLKPNYELVERYKLHSLELERTDKILTTTLDNLFYGKDSFNLDFIKLDCQGMEYDILKGAEKVLKNQCVALYIETNFFSIYEDQRLFFEVDGYLRQHGFQLYGLNPHYLSTKRIDRTQLYSQERIAWADAMYFKDPLVHKGNIPKLSHEHIDSLLIVAIIMKYYDYALELVDHYYTDNQMNSSYLVKFINYCSSLDKSEMIDDYHEVIKAVSQFPDKTYILINKFIDKHKANCDLDFVK